MQEIWQNRTRLLLGDTAINVLGKKHVLVAGVGGVGAYAAEMVVRAGIGEITIIDGDTIETTNINRQLPALNSTIGKSKVEVLEQRFKDINPALEVHAIHEFLNPENIEQVFLQSRYDYMIDAIDSISPKCMLLAAALAHRVPVVSAMGAGGKTDVSRIQVADISKTYQCPLAASIRRRLRKMGIEKNIKAVFSSEVSRGSVIENNAIDYKRSALGTISYLPAAFGCWCANVCIMDMVNASKESSREV